ncbi:protein catecholamines up [Anopheles ziemanni]|uniref:protein catecholamines up n=1 Tax=Anopheles coustani TaxID=139045 RepID=UPI002658ADBE|nr:protein catecholamines up [Anopheles coustani]XP_058173635.1 protein catecholamines up [Anopheles ziemanni]
MARLPKFLRLVMLTLVAGGICAAGTASGVDTASSMPAQPSSPPTPAAAEPATVDSENKFLKYLFNKYGSKGVISFEGLEHLMHSLGLGGLDFPGSHTLKEHRPEGYDFGDYDVFDGVNQQDPTGRIHPHQHETGATAEPPVITFASAPTSSSSGDQHHHATHYEHVHSDEDHEHNHGHPEVDERPTSTVNSRNSTATDGSTTPTRTEVPPRSVTAFREANPSDDHVWQEIIFKDMHDPRHRHPRNKNVPYCLSPRSIVHLVMEEPMLAAKQDSFRRARSLAHKHAHGPVGHHDAHDDDDDEDEDHDHGDARIEITPSEFKDLCPAFLVQLDQRACSQKLQAEANPRREKKQLFAQAWIYASACVLIISLCGLVGVAIVPLTKSIAYDDILRFLIALGVGTLSGDALMHLLPHALFPHDDSSHDDDDDHDHGHEHGSVGSDHHHHDGHSAETRAMWLCLCAFGTAFFMYSLEMILPLFRGGDGHSHHGHSHGGGHPPSNRVEPIHTAGNGTAHRGDDIELDMSEPRSAARKDKEEGAMLEKKSTKSKPMAAVAFMVVLGDGLHNITDGLAIGAAFAADPVTGLAISFAILCHELPHELGDFALLLQTGVSIRRAIFLNIVSSVLSFIGMALGLLLTGMHESIVSWIYAGTAGTFLYIALADLVPEMRNDLARSDQKVKVILIQLVGLTLGASIMLLIALNETNLQKLFD